MSVIFWLAAAFVVISILYYAAARAVALAFARRASGPPLPIPKIPPRVAILKPLHWASSGRRPVSAESRP